MRQKQVEPPLERKQIVISQPEVSSCSSEQVDEQPIVDETIPLRRQTNLHPGKKQCQQTVDESQTKVGLKLRPSISAADSAPAESTQPKVNNVKSLISRFSSIG